MGDSYPFLNVFNKKIDFEDLIDIFISYWELRSEDYHSLEVSDFIISKLIFHSLTPNLANCLVKPIPPMTHYFTYKGFKLPLTTDYSEWGGRLKSRY